jgi:hypothetical protein
VGKNDAAYEESDQASGDDQPIPRHARTSRHRRGRVIIGISGIGEIETVIK